MVHRPLVFGPSWAVRVLCRALEAEAKPASAERRGTRRVRGDGEGGAQTARGEGDRPQPCRRWPNYPHARPTTPAPPLVRPGARGWADGQSHGARTVPPP